MSEFIGPSGAKIVINPAPWKDAKELKKAVERAASASGYKIEGLSVATFAAVFLSVDGSDEVEAATWPCLARCTRGGAKIIPETFDDPAARADYYDIMLECAKVNFGPLAASLAGKLPAGLFKKTENTPPSQ